MSYDFEDAPKKRRLKPLGRLVLYSGLAGTLAVVGGAGFLWFWQPAPKLPHLLPPDTLALIELRPTLKSMIALPMLQRTYAEQFPAGQALELRSQLQAAWGLKLESDVLPWIGGEAGIAMFSPGANRQSGGRGVACIFARDARRAQAAMAKAVAHRLTLGDRVTAGAYAHVPLTTVTNAGGGGYVLAFVGDAVTFATDEATMHAHIDRAHGKDRAHSLAAAADYRAVEAALPASSLLTGFMRGGDPGVDFARNLPAAPGNGVAGAWMKSLRGSGFALAPVSTGVVFTTVAALDPAQMTPALTALLNADASYTDPALVAEAPADALMAISFRVPGAARDALASSWRGYDRELSPAAKGSLQSTGLDIERDLISWLPGDMALVLMPPAPGSPYPTTGYLAHVPEDRAAADAALARIGAALDKAVATSPYTHTQEDIAGQPWHVVRERLTNKILGGYGPVGNELRFAVGPGMVEGVGTPTTLSTTEHFKQVDAQLTGRHVGRFYANTAAGFALARPLMKTVDPATLDALATVKAVGGSAGLSGKAEGGLLTATLFVLGEPPPPADSP